ncbi:MULTISPECIES: hypothetical protein [Desulfococcus]|uniref:Uncharacterized protein n=1 Tax=Desulfococcus multivorans DSM 2059 TaxID=1121405 RepID=S7U1M6_DESML|nr:hypothetical protein [Desulfococcus multivorans]AOY58542.1 uncharacterized protein Dmul_17690 [Desulfococcus multivorans]AQV00852.1 hypothetical protein B2D07_08770 [Desulfococcus multivorans]EPR43326.1 hypothetical protein dsmv_1352 [Desulfococcus multivorans DSM 2059]SJZ42907.1 hypothetical protein SAMN02745446_00468 [Desulfococcus multivorans DSM 2059]
MDGLNIKVKNNSLAVISKLMHNACAKYECSVIYNAETNTVKFSGDDSLRSLVIEDTMNLFKKN